MKPKFGLVPKLTLLGVLLCFLANLWLQEVHDRRAAESAASQVSTGNHQGDVHAPGFTFPVQYSQAVQEPNGDVQDTVQEPAPTQTDPVPTQNTSWWAWLMAHSGLLLLLLPFIEAVVRLTPTEKDNSILNFLKYLIDMLLPNRAKGGGRHGSE